MSDEVQFSAGKEDLAERLARGRVASLSTELSDVSEVEYRQVRLERVVLAGLWTQGTQAEADDAMAELADLADTAGSQVVGRLVQRRDAPDPATYVGSGKVDEIKAIVEAAGADTVIADGELSPAQLRNLEDRLGVRVVDRTMLILDIFAQHARTNEGKTQVELAQLNYLKQRLRGWGDSLSRQVGGRAAGGVGIGGRGPGETKIETDRRRINTRVAILRRRLAGMATTRELSRNTRRRDQVPSVAIVGYTNAGKSSLLNKLTNADVLVEDALFATLDPTTRRVRAADGRVYTCTDTVGFVRHLPTDLVEAFKSTLEETAQADLLLHVVDGSGGDPLGQVAAVRAVLAQIGAGGAPELMVVNKVDAASGERLATLRHALPGAVFVSALTGEGIDGLRSTIEAGLPQPGRLVEVVVPWSRGDLIDKAHRTGEVVEMEATAEGTRLKARVRPGLAAELEAVDSDSPSHMMA